jgi:pimeloyl-ACP methyl ester carboxylesterase
MKQIVRYGNGNLLSYAEYGNKNGYPILVQHGLIASISDYHLFDRLIESGTRLICIARPGYGESSPYRMKNMAEWGDIVSILVDELNLSYFDILGMSSGAPYSYSIGYKFPEKVRNIFIFSGIPALYDDNVLAFWPYEVKKDAGITELEELADKLFFSNLSKEDLLRDDIKDSMMNCCFGIALDLKLRCMDWGFNLSDIKGNVYIQHSKTDNQVPFITAEMTSKLLSNSRFEIRENGEHFSNELLDDFIKTTMAKNYESKKDYDVRFYGDCRDSMKK